MTTVDFNGRLRGLSVWAAVFVVVKVRMSVPL